MRWLTLLMVVALVGCSAQDRSPAAVAVPAEAPTATPEPTPTPAPAPVAAPQLENPVISVGAGTIPFVPSLTLRSATVSADVVTMLVRRGKLLPKDWHSVGEIETALTALVLELAAEAI